MEGGRKPYDLQPVDAAALAAEIVGDFRKEVAPRSFTIDLEVERTADIQLRADAASDQRTLEPARQRREVLARLTSFACRFVVIPQVSRFR